MMTEVVQMAASWQLVASKSRELVQQVVQAERCSCRSGFR
jgi:hypothetical protein